MNQKNTFSTPFNDSFKRCINDPLFLDKFYDIFFSSSDEVFQMFKNTEMETQKVMLMTSLVYMSDVSCDRLGLLKEIADKHDKNNLNIKPHLYAVWLDSLVLAATFIDPLFDEAIEVLWRDTLQPGIDIMISRYNKDWSGGTII